MRVPNPWRWHAAITIAVLSMALASVGHSQELDDVLLDGICADAGTGPDLQAQCAVFDLDSPTRGAAAAGNNFGIAGGTGRGKTDVRDRLEALREGEEEQGSGQAADWVIGKLGIFISGDGAWLDRDNTGNEIGHDTLTAGFTAGADWRFSDAFIAGAAFSYSRGSTEFNNNAGDLDTDSYSALLFASFAPNDIIYFDAYIGYGFQDYEGKRNIAFVAGGVPVAARANSDTDGTEFTAGMSAAADFALGAFTLGPHAQLDYVDTDVDGYAESGGAGFAAAFGDQSIESTQSVIGVHLSYAASTSWGVLVPYGRLDWVHEFQDKARSIPTSFVQSPGNPFVTRTDKATRDFGRITLGISALWAGGWAAFADYQNEFAQEDQTEHRLSIGLRREF